MVFPAATTEHNSMPIVGTVYKTYQLVSLIPSVSQILFSAAKKIRPANAFFPTADNLRPSPNTKTERPWRR